MSGWEIIGRISDESTIKQVPGFGEIHIQSLCLVPVNDTLIRDWDLLVIRVELDCWVRAIIDEEQMHSRLQAVYAPGDSHVVNMPLGCAGAVTFHAVPFEFLCKKVLFGLSKSIF